MAKDALTTETSRPWWLLAFVVGAIVGLTVGRFERLAIAEASGFSAGLIVLLAWCFWHERRRRWFWGYLAAVVIAHGILIATAPWPDRWQAGRDDGPLGFADVILMFGIGYIVSSLADKLRKPGSSGGAQAPR